MQSNSMRIRRDQRSAWRKLAWAILALGLGALVGALGGLQAIAVAVLVVALFVGFLAAWLVLGVATAGMNSQGVALLHFHEQRMHFGAANAQRTHSAGIRMVAFLLLLSGALFALGGGLHFLSTAV